VHDSQQNTSEVLQVQPRFFVAPKLDDRLKAIIVEAKNQNPKIPKKDKKLMLYAGYVRISSEEQVGNYSIEAQSRAIRTWVQAQGGQLVELYSDEAQSGRSADRPEFLRMRQDARKHKFDALIVHKFDRFSRNRTDALAIKSLLRYDYGIKVFSVSEPSEDSDGPIGALIEGIIESVAEWYSRNLATEMSKGRHEKTRQGLHNNQPPFGLMREGKTQKLIPNPKELPGLCLAFESYATGQYGYAELARLLNTHGYRSISGRQFTKDTVRALLRNKIYIGKIRYQPTSTNAQGKRTFTEAIEWHEGQHDAVIPIELFEQCQAIRAERTKDRQSQNAFAPYLLRGMVYCEHCSTHRSPETDFPGRGRMRCQHNRNKLYYRCSANEQGLHCLQGGAVQETINAEVIASLSKLKAPADWQSRILQTIGMILGDKSLEQRLGEIRATIERMDFRWDNGFITDKTDYLEKRVKLQQEIEKLTPAHQELDAAVDLLNNFSAHIERCGNDIERQHELLKLILDRVYINDGHVTALTLKADYHVVLGDDGTEAKFIEAETCVPFWPQRYPNRTRSFFKYCRLCPICRANRLPTALRIGAAPDQRLYLAFAVDRRVRALLHT